MYKYVDIQMVYLLYICIYKEKEQVDTSFIQGLL